MRRILSGHKTQGVLKMISLPAAVFILMNLIDLAVTGKGVISSSTDAVSLLRNILITFCFALAINCNLRVGRMDLSLGSQMYFACIFGGNLALQLNLGGVGVLIFSLALGLLCGFVVGFLYVQTRILPMIFGMGITLIFECISFGAFNQQGLMLFGKPGVSILSKVWFVGLIMILVLGVMTFLFQYSSFGFKGRAIQGGGQRLAADAGVNIYVNCVISYTLAGVLAACSGVFNTAFLGTLVPALDMSSNSQFFGSMFPMFVGTWLGLFVGNPVLGVLCGTISVRLLGLGLAKLSMSSSMQNVIIFALFLLFMILRDNMKKLGYQKKRRARIALALETRRKMALG